MFGFAKKLTSIYSRRLVIIVATVVLGACGADSEGQETAVEPVDLVDTQPLRKVEGEWQGLLSCSGRDFPTRITVKGLDDDQLEVRWTLTPALGRKNYISPDGRTEITDRVLIGDYEPITGRADVEEQVESRPLRLDLLFGEEFVLLSYQRCDFGLLQRPPPETLTDLQSELLAIQEQVVIRTEDQQGECPDELQQWIQAGLDLPLDQSGRGDMSALWTDAVTQPIFGEPVADLRAERRREIRRALSARCMIRRDRRQNAVVRALLSITDYRLFRDGRFIALAGPVAKEWLENRAQPLLLSEPLPDLSYAAGEALELVPKKHNFERLLADASTYDPKAYAQQIVAVNKVMIARREEQSYLSNMRGADFFRMQELWQAALRREDIRDEPANALVAEVLVDKAVEFSREAEARRDAVRMARWVSGVESRLICSEALQDLCAEATEPFKDRLDELSDEFADTERPAFETLSDQAPSLENLAALVKANKTLVGRYGRVLEYGDFRDLVEDYEELRFDWQKEQEDALAEQLANARTTSALAALDERYFRPGDLSGRTERHLKRLGNVYDGQLAGTRPFVGTGSDAYLNALYNREFNSLASMDAELLAGVAPALRFLSQQVSSMAELFGTAGRPLQSAARELNNPSAVTAVALRYLVDYEDEYGSCLGADAVTVTFTERVDTVTRTANGIEVSRIEGVPMSSTFRIKREHADLFQDVFSRPAASSGADGVIEALFGLEGVSQLTNAVSELMDEHRCDSEEVQGFEEGMLAYYANRKRQWGR
ncbi:MAG: hypothetical protein AAGH76_08765 [Pseudomonadota bacterium]